MFGPMHSPSHPGAIIRDTLEGIAEETGQSLTVGQAAEALDVCRQTLSGILNGKAGISTDMAFRLSKAFGSSPEFWLRLQEQYDLAETRKRISTEEGTRAMDA